MLTSAPKSELSRFRFDQSDIDAPKLKSNPFHYIIDDALESAVKVALLLKQPLLLTGKPGTGKTRLAEKLAIDLHEAFGNEYLETPLTFHTKTVSTFTDLFYTYDALGHFHDATFNKDKIISEASDHIQLQALGQAIILSNDNYLDKGSPQYCPYKNAEGINKEKSCSSVVLIDEVDKAPRDFANDLLDELDRYRFAVKEDRGRMFEKGNRNIFVILTSNSEKNLPDAFLRRCIYYNIAPPGEEMLLEIVKNQISFENKKSDQQKNEINNRLKEYITWFSKTVGGINDNGKSEKGELNLKKEPATAELISWIYYLRNEIIADIPLREVPTAKLRASYSILGKHEEDLKKLVENV